jgi:hypothetical protein
MAGTKEEQICSCFVLIDPTPILYAGALNLNYPPHKKIIKIHRVVKKIFDRLCSIR